MNNWTAGKAFAHHGILGQKWGKRNGPPYPLDAKDHSASERRAGWRKSLDKDSPAKKSGLEEGEDRKGLSDNQKKWIKRGAIAAGFALAAYGGYKLYTSGKIEGFIQNGKNVFSEKDFGSSEKIDSMFSAASTINPGYKAGEGIDFLMQANDGYPLSHVNCQACTLAYDLKQRFGEGISQAQLVDTREYSANYLIDRFYKNPIKETTSIAQLNDALSSLGDGARGNLLLRTAEDGNHSVAFQVIGKSVNILDCQRGEVFDLKSGLLEVLYSPDPVCGFVRTDNLELNDVEFIKRFVVGKFFD